MWGVELSEGQNTFSLLSLIKPFASKMSSRSVATVHNWPLLRPALIDLLNNQR